MFTPEEFHCVFDLVKKHVDSAPDSAIIESALQKLKEQCDANPLEEPEPSDADLDLTDMTVLIVEDDASSADLLKASLEEIKVGTVIKAENGREAIEQIQERKGDVSAIVCDWFMPEMSGIEVLQRIRKIEKLKTIPFIMATATSDKDHIKQAIQSGVTDFVVKPLDINQFQEKFKKALLKSKKLN